MDGNLDALERHLQKEDEAERNAPHCSCCGEAIWEDYYNINGEILCDECLDKRYRVRT